MPRQFISFRAPDSLLAPMGERAETHTDERYSFADVARRDLERYYLALTRDRQRLTGRFSAAELRLLVDSANATRFLRAEDVGLLWAHVDDAIRCDGLAEKWEADGPALVAKIRDLSFAETCLLVDALERHWNRVALDEQPDPAELLT